MSANPCSRDMPTLCITAISIQSHDGASWLFYDITNMQPTDFEIEKAESPTTATTTESIGDIHEDSAGTIVSENSDDVNPSSGNSRSSSRKSTDMSNRALLANALESAAQNHIERNRLQQYKAKIDILNQAETRLRELRERIKQYLMKYCYAI